MLDKLYQTVSNLFGDSDNVQNTVAYEPINSIADLLPYLEYDSVNELYINKNSIGIVLEATPLNGASEKTVKSITSMVKHDMPEGTSIQFLNYASPKVGPVFEQWLKERKKTGGIYDKLADSRVEYLKQYVWKPFFENNNIPRGFVIRNYAIIISISLPIDKASTNAREKLISMGSNIRTTLNNMNMNCQDMKPDRFIEFLDEIINVNGEFYNRECRYNPYQAINKQVTSPETKITVKPDRLLVNDGEYEIRSFSVRNYPEVWTQWESSALIGDFWESTLQIPCPFITMFSFTTQNDDKNKARASLKASRATQQAGTGISRYMPEIDEQARDWSFVRTKLNDGQRLVKAYYQVVIFAPRGKAENIESSVKELYGSYGWQLARDKYVQMQSFMASLPMTLSEGLADDLDRLGRTNIMVSWTCANVAPLQGEWKGMRKPYLMLIGRRGQPLYWNPFQNMGGNYNVAVIGKSGSGKSVFMQELVASMRGAGGRVVVIDDGHSFKHSCGLQNGDFVEFSKENNICLNPFSMIDEETTTKDREYLTDVMLLINQMVQQMCKATERTNDIENSFIQTAINTAWKENGAKATISNVKDHLFAHKDKRAVDLGTMLMPFCGDGIYGKYFEGQANISLSSPLMVFELSELKSRKHLQGIVMMLLMFIVTEEMHKDRTVNTSLVIDEAWDLLHGKSTGGFIEGIARRARKYGGNLVTGTQSMNDYYKNPAATAAIENTDWYCLLAQNPESIAQLKKNAKLVMTEHTERVMKSLHVEQNRYSEVMIKGPDVEVVGRLILDPYSMALYSSTGSDFAQVEKFVNEGMTLESAVDRLAQNMRRANG